VSEYRPYMTNAMLDVYDGFEQEMQNECLFCLEKLKEANIAANVKLPCKTESGNPVRHGARVEINKISNYWYMRLQYAARFVSRDFEDEHELWNKNVGI
jgi:hypothetical protein